MGLNEIQTDFQIFLLVHKEKKKKAKKNSIYEPFVKEKKKKEKRENIERKND